MTIEVIAMMVVTEIAIISGQRYSQARLCLASYFEISAKQNKSMSPDHNYTEADVGGMA